MRSRIVVLLTALVAVLVGVAAPAQAADPAVNLTPPEVTGKAAVGVKLVADPGTWLPADATFTYQWLATARNWRRRRTGSIDRTRAMRATGLRSW